MKHEFPSETSYDKNYSTWLQATIAQIYIGHRRLKTKSICMIRKTENAITLNMTIL